VIEVHELTRRFASPGRADGVLAVDRASFAVAARECLVLLGGSGSGKTTTLKMLNRLIEPTSGSVRLAGRDTREMDSHDLRRRIGYAFQEVGLFPHMTVGENVGITPMLLGWKRKQISDRVAELLDLVELPPGEFLARTPDQLSGGQQQRVGLARALAAEPEVLLLDEPFGSLDPITRDRLQQFFQRIRSEVSMTVVFVTHDMTEALLLGDRIGVMREGRLVQLGTPRELLLEPAGSYVAELMETPRRQTRVVDELLGVSAPERRS
jgi:osmoprotectant transport system ATP-binding protein